VSPSRTLASRISMAAGSGEEAGELAMGQRSVDSSDFRFRRRPNS
jgi:hypothetical protein